MRLTLLLSTLLLTLSSCLTPTSSPDPFADFEAKVEAITSEITTPHIPNREVDLIDFAGHEPDYEGSYNFQPAINRAIQTLAEQGGGTLRFRHTAPPQQWYKFPMVYRSEGKRYEDTFDRSEAKEAPPEQT